MFSHEQEQNRYRPSSIADKVNITNKMNKKAPGGDWGLTQKLLQGILGDAKRATCYRWVCLARDLHEEVLNYIKTTRKHLTAGFLAPTTTSTCRSTWSATVPTSRTLWNRSVDWPFHRTALIHHHHVIGLIFAIRSPS